MLGHEPNLFRSQGDQGCAAPYTRLQHAHHTKLLFLTQVTRLCRTHQLHSALAFLFTRALSDYAAPAAELLLAHAHAPTEDARGDFEGPWGMRAKTGYKLLVYLKCGLSGKALPPGWLSLGMQSLRYN